MMGSMDTAVTLRAARIESGLTQAELAARAGTSQATVSAYESGGKKPSVAKKKDHPAAVPNDTAAVAVPSEGATVKTPAALEGSLVVLAKLKELEFHSRANLERLAELTLTVEDELKQKAIVSPLAEVYSAQSVFQTKLTALIEAYKAECDRMQGESG